MDANTLTLPITFYARPMKMLRILLVGVIFVGLGVWLYANANDIGRYSPAYIKCISVGCIVFFGFGTVAATLRMIRREPLFIFTEEGITGGSNIPLIPWDNIADARPVSIRNKVFVGVFLKNIEAHYAGLSGFSLMAAKSATGMVGTPVALHARLAGMQPEELAAIIKRFAATSK